MSEKPKRPRGRPCTYSAEVADRICFRMAEGEGLATICRDDGMPPESTVREWVLDDREGFAARYARAVTLRTERLMDELVSIADDTSKDTIETEDGERPNTEWMARSRLRIDTRKWLASKLLPKKYGDKQEVEVTGKLTLAQLIEQSRKVEPEPE